MYADDSRPSIAAPASVHRTRYPVVLVHGLGWRDDAKLVGYWGSIPDALRSLGTEVYLSGQDSWGSIESNAAVLAACIDGIVRETGCGKVNIIAHSKGGLEARYAVSTLGRAERVASVTTLCTPHRGTYIAEYLLERFRFAYDEQAFMEFVNGIAGMLGDTAPDLLTAGRQLTRPAAAAFNEANPDAPGVYCQSFAACLSEGEGSPFLRPLYRILFRIEGPNDGLVPVSSARWGRFRGVICREEGGAFAVKSDPDREELSVSHQDVTAGGAAAEALYAGIVRELAAMGY